MLERIMEGSSEEVTFEQRPDGKEIGAGLGDRGGINSKCKGPDLGMMAGIPGCWPREQRTGGHVI